MATKIQLRHDTSANWAAVNPILSAGELGFEVDTNKAKIGNGIGQYNDLPYVCEEVIKNYNDLQTKPSINGIELVGDTTLDELNIQVKGEYVSAEDLATELASKANIDDLANYASKEELGGYATVVALAEGLELKADKEVLSEYAVATEVDEKLELKADKETTYTKEEVDALIPTIPSELTIPTKVSELENDLGFISAVSEEYITEEELATALEPYAKAEELAIPTKVSELENDSKFVTEEVLETIYTKEEIDAKNYLTEHQDISGKADVSALPAETSLMVGEAPVVADLEATEVADLVTALNEILAQLRTRGVIA